MSVEERRPAKRRRVQHEYGIKRLDFPRIAQYFTPDAPIIIGRFVLRRVL